MKCDLLIVIAAFALTSKPFAVVADHPEAVPQREFVISFMIPPPFSENSYRQIANAHFNTVPLLHNGTDAQRQEMVRYLEALELRFMAYTANVPFEALCDLPQGAECMGYFLGDEPGADQFSALALKTREIRRLRPDKLVFANLYPNWATTKQLQASAYEEYVDRYLAAVAPDVLCFDHYPLIRPDQPIEPGWARYHSNLALIRAKALEREIPFWVFVNAMPYSTHTAPTEAQLRWQINASLAYGTKGILYFAYYTLPDWHEFRKGGALVAADGRTTRQYEHAKRINLELKNIGPVLMDLTSDAVIHIGAHDNASRLLENCAISHIGPSESTDPPHNYLIGTFRHKDGRRAVMINNGSFSFSAWATVVFDADIQRVTEVARQSGEEVPVQDESPNLPGFQISLDASDSRLFLLPANQTDE